MNDDYTTTARQVETDNSHTVSVCSHGTETRIEIGTDTAVVFTDIDDPNLLHAIAGFLHAEAGRLQRIKEAAEMQSA